MQESIAWLKAGILTIVAFFAPTHSILSLVGMLVILDLVTGLAAAIKRGKRISSSKFSGSIAKSCVYLFAICTAHIVQGLIADQPVLRMVGAIIGMREALSVFENLNLISGTNLMSAIIDKLRSDNDKS